MLSNIACFLIGWVAGVVTVIIYACLVLDSRLDREEEYKNDNE